MINKLNPSVINTLNNTLTDKFLSLKDSDKLLKDIGIADTFIKRSLLTSGNGDLTFSDLTNMVNGKHFPIYPILKEVSIVKSKEFIKSKEVDEDEANNLLYYYLDIDIIFIKVIIVTFLKIFNRLANFGQLTSMCHLFLDNLEVLILRDKKIVNEDPYIITYGRNKNNEVSVLLDIIKNDYTVDLKDSFKMFILEKMELLKMVMVLYKRKKNFKDKELLFTFKEFILDSFQLMDDIVFEKFDEKIYSCKDCNELFMLNMKDVDLKKDNGHLCPECLRNLNKKRVYNGV